MFRAVHNRTRGVDGWVSLEVSPLLAHDTASTIAPGLNSQVGSVASIFISRWDVAILGKVQEELNNRLGMALPVASTRRTLTY